LRITGLDGASKPCPRLSHLGEHSLFVLGVTLHGIHEIRHQIRPALQLHGDLLLRLRSGLIELLYLIVSAATNS
jgi:hypothetical protein